MTGAVATLDLTTFTVGTGSNRCLVGIALFDTTISNLTLTWDQGGTNQAMTQAHTYSDSGQVHYLFVLIAPTSGNKTLRASWTTNSKVHLGAAEFSGADQTTCYKAADNATAGPSTNFVQVTVTSSTDGATVAASASVFGSYVDCGGGNNQTSIFRNNPGGINGSATYALGGASNIHCFETDTANDDALGIHILALATVGGYILTEAGDCLNAENGDRLITEDVTVGVGPCVAGGPPQRTLIGVGT